MRAMPLTSAELNALPKGLKTTNHFTDIQKRFLNFWAQGETIRGAAERSGMQLINAKRLAQSKPALEYYHAEKRKFEEASKMSRKKVMDMLVEAYELAKLAAEPSSMVAAAREIGKMCGYYAPTETKVQVDVTGNIAVQRINAMTDEELIRMISENPSPPPLLEHDDRDPT